MNALELADELDKFSDLGGDIFFAICADSLRQQAGKIEKLKAEAKAKNNYLDQHCQKIDALYNLVKEQDKKIIDLAFKLAYSERSAQLAYDPKKHGAEE